MDLTIGMYKGDMKSEVYDPVIDAVRDLPVVDLVSDVWTVDCEGLKSYQASIETSSETAKTLTITNVSQSNTYSTVGIRLKVTTACSITYTNMTFADGPPTLAAGDVVLIGAETVDNGANYNAIATHIIKGA